MRGVTRAVDLTHVPTVPWAWVDERVYAAICGCSVKVLLERSLGEVVCGSPQSPPPLRRKTHFFACKYLCFQREAAITGADLALPFGNPPRTSATRQPRLHRFPERACDRQCAPSPGAGSSRWSRGQSSGTHAPTCRGARQSGRRLAFPGNTWIFRTGGSMKSSSLDSSSGLTPASPKWCASG